MESTDITLTSFYCTCLAFPKSYLNNNSVCMCHEVIISMDSWIFHLHHSVYIIYNERGILIYMCNKWLFLIKGSALLDLECLIFLLFTSVSLIYSTYIKHLLCH